MEPTSTNSSDQTRVHSQEQHELHNMTNEPSSLSPQPQQVPARARVRFNSSAAEIPPRPERPSYNQISENDGTATPIDQHAANAQNLLDAHNEGCVNETYEPTTYASQNPEEGYAVTGNATGGIFYQLLQAYKTPVPALNESPSEASTSRPGSSGAMTPRKKWYNAEKANHSQETLATLIGASAKLANPNEKKEMPSTRPPHKRTNSGGVLAKVWKAKEDKDARIKVHVAAILKRQQYIIRMCRALMLFGAPTHRLEEYLATTATVLEITSQFLYIPGCMLISCKNTFQSCKRKS